MSTALDALRAAAGKLHKDPAKVWVRVTGTTTHGWIARAGLLVPTGSGTEATLVSPGHADDVEAWRALLATLRGGAP